MIHCLDLDEDELDRLARDLGARARPPLLILLEGSLGAGKTRFTRAFVGGHDVNAEGWVSSPTWSLCNEYPADPPLYHLDLYRVEDEDDLESIGLRELLDGYIVLVEWASRAPELQRAADVRVELEHLPARERRRLRVELVSERAQAQLTAVLKR